MQNLFIQNPGNLFIIFFWKEVMVEWRRNWMFGGIVFAFDFLRISTTPPLLNNVQCQVQSRDEIETHRVPAKETFPKGNEWTCWKLREEIRSLGFWTPSLITQTNLIKLFLNSFCFKGKWECFWNCVVSAFCTSDFVKA